MDNTKIAPLDIVEAARTLINTPYKHQGRTRYGLDCSGVIVVTAMLAGLTDSIWGETNYSRNSNNSLQKGLERYCYPMEKLQVGTVALFKLSPIPYHCGIITNYEGDLGLLHAYENVGKVREHALIPWWRDKIYKIYGFPNVNYDC